MTGPKSLGKLSTTDGLCRHFATLYRLSLKDARALVKGVFSIILSGVEESGRVHIKDFGVFYRKAIKAHRVAAPPGTDGAMVRIPASVRIGFRAAKAQKRVKR